MFKLNFGQIIKNLVIKILQMTCYNYSKNEYLIWQVVLVMKIVAKN